MRVCVYGLWHLGSVTAACLAEHFDTVAYDPDEGTRVGLRRAAPPISEPGLAELVSAGLASTRLTISDDLASAVAGADVVWVTFDTPVTDEDVADTSLVERHVRALFPHLSDGTVVLVSSQVPVGFTGRMEAAFRLERPNRAVRFAYSPENLRLGNALQVFRHPERIVVGVRTEADRAILAPLFAPFCERILWMSVESAEMTKHALNAFLAVSVTFINEIASICEVVGADALDVGAGLKSDVRIGPKAYLGAGSAFAGGTLARDLVFLRELAEQRGGGAKLIASTFDSNLDHKLWPQRTIERVAGDLRGKRIAVLGLTYKPGTDTLRRSEAVAFARWLVRQGSMVEAFDPAVAKLPDPIEGLHLRASAHEAISKADAAIVATEWPVFRELAADDVVSRMKSPVILDPNRFLRATLGSDPRIRYFAVGKPESQR
jgi:UDPglucose 6-dehydrogenase